jgi:hypothetical protein
MHSICINTEKKKMKKLKTKNLLVERGNIDIGSFDGWPYQLILMMHMT